MSQGKMICYCFGFFEEDIRADVGRHDRSAPMEKIMAEKKADACRCAEANPAGCGCPADVRWVAEQHQKRLQT